MKNFIRFAFLCMLSITGLFSHVTYAQIVSIPDSNFKSFLVNSSINTNMDGEIQVTEAAAVTGGFGVQSNNISDLTGVEAFVNMTYLDCSNNNLTSLDLSANTKLQSLFADSNQISYLDLRNKDSLMNISFVYNLLDTLLIDSSSTLWSITADHNLFTSFNAGLFPNLYYFTINYNDLIDLDLSNNPKLVGIGLGGSVMSSYDFGSIPLLEEITIDGSNFTTLDVSDVPLLDYLNIENSSIHTIDFGTNNKIWYFRANNSQLTSLDLSAHTDLSFLFVNDLPIYYLNIKNGTNTTNFLQPDLRNCPNLYCVVVDTPSTIVTYTLKDAHTVLVDTSCPQIKLINGSSTDLCVDSVIELAFCNAKGSYFEWLKNGVSLGPATLNDSILSVSEPGFYSAVLDSVGQPITTHEIEIYYCDSLVARYEGTVFMDLDSNGIMDGSDYGLAGIKIQVDNGQYTYSNSDGYYVLRLDPGTYEMTTVPPDFLGCNGNLSKIGVFSTLSSDTVVISAIDTTYSGLNFGIAEPDYDCGTICGTVWLDDNENGIKDSGEVGYPGINIKLTPGGYVQTDVNGDYCAEVAKGQQIIVDFVPGHNLYYCARPHPQQTYPQGPNNYKITVTSGAPNSTGNDFGIKDMNVGKHEVGIYSLRTYYGNISGLDFKAWMDYKNSGDPNPDSCFLTVYYDDDYVDDLGGHSKIPISSGSGFVTWGFGPGQTPAFDCMGMNFHIDTSAHVGDSLHWSAEYACQTLDKCIENNNKSRSVVVVNNNKNTFDYLNNMQVYILDDEVNKINTDMDSTLSYVINYQNVGEDSVFHIRIVDTLPPQLNIETVSKPFGTLPTATFCISNDNVLIWESDQVSIPGSQTDYLKSYGFVQFDVIVKPNLTSGAVITNDATIQYNYDRWVTTSATKVVVQSTDTNGIANRLSADHSILIYPNPSTGMVQVRLEDQISGNGLMLFQLSDLSGRLIYSKKLNRKESTLNLSDLDTGMYFYSVFNGNKNVQNGKLMLK